MWSSCIGWVIVCDKEGEEVFIRECKAEVGWKLRVLCGEVTHVSPRVALCDQERYV